MSDLSCSGQASLISARSPELRSWLTRSAGCWWTRSGGGGCSASNVPVGVVALIAGIFLLPRTRERNPGFRISLDPVRKPSVRRGLFGAAGGYLVLFGPLVLVPVILAGRGESALVSGLVLTTLPVGFAVGASFLKCRGTAALAFSTAALVALLVLPFEPVVLVPLLGVLGLGPRRLRSREQRAGDGLGVGERVRDRQRPAEHGAESRHVGRRVSGDDGGGAGAAP